MRHAPAWGLCALLAVLPVHLHAAAAEGAGEALRRAASAGDAKLVAELIVGGAAVDDANDYGATALHFAADRGRTAVVKVLLANGADPNRRDTYYGTSALPNAAQRGHVEVVELLLAKGATDVAGALQAAIYGGHADVVRAVLAQARPDSSALTEALVASEQAEHPAIAELLKAAGARPPAPATFPVPAELLARYLGVYVDELGIERRVELVDGGLRLITGQGESLALGGLDEDTFRPAGMYGVELDFAADPGNPASTLTVRSPGSPPLVLRRKEDSR